MAAQKKKNAGTTQKFIEIQDIVEDTVLLPGGNACLIIEVQATNFALLSREEQAARISGYASLLNALTFPIQIIIKNKRVDISSYIKLLESEAQKTTNEKLSMQISLYRDFIQEVVKVNTVLDKKFYIVIPYNPLEKGAVQVMKNNDPAASAKQSLRNKAETVHSQLARINLKAQTLEKENLVKLFYEIYNQDVSQTTTLSDTLASPLVQTQNGGGAI